MEPVMPRHFFPRSGRHDGRVAQLPAVEGAPCLISGAKRAANAEPNGRYSGVYLLCTGSSPELSNEAAAAAVGNSHRQRKRMNSHPGEECINRTEHGPPRQ